MQFLLQSKTFQEKKGFDLHWKLVVFIYESVLVIQGPAMSCVVWKVCNDLFGYIGFCRNSLICVGLSWQCEMWFGVCGGILASIHKKDWCYIWVFWSGAMCSCVLHCTVIFWRVDNMSIGISVSNIFCIHWHIGGG